MLQVGYHTAFKQDWKLAERRGWDMAPFLDVIQRLAREEKLEPRFRQHRLKGKYHQCLECHVAGDRLLVWEHLGDKLVFYRIGTHADLFR